MKKIALYNILTLLLFVSFLSGCGKREYAYYSPDDYRGKLFTNSDQAWDGYRAIKDTLQNYWDLMIESDRKKFNALEEIQKKIKRSGEYNKTSLEDAIGHLDKVKNFNFTEELILDDANIDLYDSLTNNAINATTRLMDETPDGCEKCLDAYKKVNELEDLLIAYRIHYDDWADLHNWYIEKYRNKLEKEFVDPNQLSPKPLFRIREEK